MQDQKQQVTELQQMFFKLGSVVELLGMAGYTTGHMTADEVRSSVVCACVTVDEVAMQIHGMADRLMVALPFAGEEIPYPEDEGQGDVLSYGEI